MGEHTSHQDMIDLLTAAGLPTEDITDASAIAFFGQMANDELIGLVGLECAAPHALLRSLVVAPSQRGGGIGKQLVQRAEHEAAQRGVQHLWLLTTTAEHFFAGLGYSKAERADAPPEIAATSQFASICPSSSAFMHKALAELA